MQRNHAIPGEVKRNRWLTALIIALPLAWITMNVIGLRWEPIDGGRQPWGAPLPWLNRDTATSLSWEICYLFLLVDLWANMIPFIAFAMLLPMPAKAQIPLRIAGAALTVLVVSPVIVMTAMGWLRYFSHFDLKPYGAVQFAIEFL